MLDSHLSIPFELFQTSKSKENCRETETCIPTKKTDIFSVESVLPEYFPLQSLAKDLDDNEFKEIEFHRLYGSILQSPIV